MDIHAPMTDHFRLTEFERKALKKLGIENIEDLLYHFPARYGSAAEARTIANLQKGNTAVVYGTLSKLEAAKAFRKRIPMATAQLADDTGKIQIVWFNQPYIAKMFADGALVRIEGKVASSATSRRGGMNKLYFSNPKIERVAKIPVVGEATLFTGESASASVHRRLHPVYPESRGISSNWIFHAIQKIISAKGGKLGVLSQLADPIPSQILKKYHLPTLATALIWIHAPKKEDDAIAARKRFAFEEIFFIQLERQKARALRAREPAFAVSCSTARLAEFTSRFPFPLTRAQARAIATILADLKKEKSMARLLEGDVGSGKTAVAATAAYAVVAENLQTAYMCPTEILAKQQFDNFISFFAHLPVQVGLITSSGCRKFPSKVNPHEATDISRAQLLKWVANGEIPILVGTHALIQKSVKFKRLALVVIDEQHRFGVAQRKKLARKGEYAPHLLSMTATPIPRTLALTLYGDLDLTILDEMPPDRKPVVTKIILPNERAEAYEHIRTEIRNGRQAFVICPRIDVPDPTKESAVQARSAKKEAERLKKEVFPEYAIAVIHSKLKDVEKEHIMEAFKDGRTQILVSTSVVEVGVNVPNATCILIEGAERFGLAQLHQLRGRVLRSAHQAYCFVSAESVSAGTLARLKALTEAKNGFELAECDLQIRGAGKLSGLRQWGVSDVAMEALRNLKMVEAARAEAERLVVEDEPLAHYPTLASELARRARRGSEVHFE